MKLLKSFFMAFSMYSKIPMPKVRWAPENMAYTLCFFPFVGIAVGGVMLLWIYFARTVNISPLLFASVAVALPALLTGCIHIDGLMDTADALASRQDTARKLEILKDSHVGAFGVICCVIYCVLLLGFWSQFEYSLCAASVISLSFVLSRCLSGIAAVTFKNARGSGILATFLSAAHVKATKNFLIIMTVLTCAGMLALSPVYGGAAVLGACFTFVYYRVMCYRQFGGTTGDIAGFFLQICELVCLICVVAVQLIAGG